MAIIGHYKVHPDYVDKIFEEGKHNIVLIDKKTDERIHCEIEILDVTEHNEDFMGSLKRITTASYVSTIKMLGTYRPYKLYVTLSDDEKIRWDTPTFTKRSSYGTGYFKRNTYNFHCFRRFERERIGYIPTGVLKIYEENGIWK